MENQNFQLENFEGSGVGSGKPAVVGDIPKMEQKIANNSEDEQCEEKNEFPCVCLFKSNFQIELA